VRKWSGEIPRLHMQHQQWWGETTSLCLATKCEDCRGAMIAHGSAHSHYTQTSARLSTTRTERGETHSQTNVLQLVTVSVGTGGLRQLCPLGPYPRPVDASHGPNHLSRALEYWSGASGRGHASALERLTVPIPTETVFAREDSDKRYQSMLASVTGKFCNQ
jgi:hypothetical protein